MEWETGDKEKRRGLESRSLADRIAIGIGLNTASRAVIVTKSSATKSKPGGGGGSSRGSWLSFPFHVRCHKVVRSLTDNYRTECKEEALVAPPPQGGLGHDPLPITEFGEGKRSHRMRARRLSPWLSLSRGSRRESG